jgi:prefoldin subunit 5
MLSILISRFIAPYAMYLQIAMIVVALGGVGFVYYKWEAAVKATALLKLKNDLLEEIIVEHENHTKFLESQIDVTNKLIEDKNKQIRELDLKFSEMEKEIQNRHPDAEASPILKDTLDAIKSGRGRP